MEEMNKANLELIEDMLRLYQEERKNFALKQLEVLDDLLKDIPDDHIPADLDQSLAPYIEIEMAKKGLFNSRLEFVQKAIKRLKREKRLVMGTKDSFEIKKEDAKQVPIEHVCEALGVEIKRNFGKCPIHEEHTPSFKIYPNTNSWFCFGCGSGGDVITLVEKTTRKNFVETLKYLLTI